jgi:helix-turn-helix protein
MANDENLKLAPREIAAAFDGTSAMPTPPVLTVDEAAALLRVPKQTVYDWRSRGLCSDAAAGSVSVCCSFGIASSKKPSTKA